jgi:hypothetical protein
MTDWSIPMRAEALRAELQHTARNERLSRLGRTSREGGQRALCRVLAWVGSRLLAAGVQLQHRYGVPANPAPLHG